MALHLVGETLDKTRSHYGAETGKLVQLMRGIYVDSDDDIDAIVLGHAVRIAKYLYPHAYLSAASAALLGPTRDGRLFLSARRKPRTRIRSLEIIQNEAPAHPSIGSAVIDDGMGEFHVNVSSIRQRFLEAFRLRSEHAASIDQDMREAIAARLIEEYRSPQAAADAVWALARENEWYREGELAERSLLRRPAAAPVKNQAELDLIVAWHGSPNGHLRHDGFEWRWDPIEGGGPPLIRQTTPGKLPPCYRKGGWKRFSRTRTNERCCGQANATCRISRSLSSKASCLRCHPIFYLPVWKNIRRPMYLRAATSVRAAATSKRTSSATSRIFTSAPTRRGSRVSKSKRRCTSTLTARSRQARASRLRTF